jgi:hypothetical protein
MTRLGVTGVAYQMAGIDAKAIESPIVLSVDRLVEDQFRVCGTV